MKSLLNYLYKVFVQIPKLSFELSEGFFAASVLWCKIVYFVVSRKFFYQDKPMVFKLVYQQNDFSIELQNSFDLAALIEIFVLKEYEWVPDMEIKTILDLGAHWGDTALYYALRFPNATIYSFEPMPETYQRLVQVTQNFPNIKTFNYALAKESGVAAFHTSDNSLGNSLTKREQSTQSIEVKTASLDDIRSMCKVDKFDLVKFDIEGAENVLFQSGKLAEFGQAYIGEIHLDLLEYTLEDIKTNFKSFKFEFIKISEHRFMIQALSN